MQPAGEIQRSLSAELNNDTLGLFLFDDVHHVLERERLEVETVGCVVIRRHGLGIAVDHDGLEIRVAECKTRMAAAVVELYSLPDTVRSGSEDHDLAPFRRIGFTFFFVGRIHVGRERFELGTARIDAFVDRNYTEGFAVLAHSQFRRARKKRQPPIRQTVFFRRANFVVGIFDKRLSIETFLKLHHLRKLIEEPGIDLSQAIYLIDRIPVLQRVGDVRETLRVRTCELPLQFFVRNVDEPQRLHSLERPQTLEQALLERSSDRHHLTDRLHLCAEYIFGARKFFECPLRDLRDDVIDSWLERCRCLPRYIVRDLIQRVTDCQFCGDLCDRKSSRFRRKR